MKKVFLTGGGGAIGVHTIAHIMHNTDWDIVVVDSFKPEHKGYFDRLSTLLENHSDWRLRISTFIHDLNTPITQREIEKLGHVDYIINLASRSDVQDSVDNPIPFVRNNIELMMNVLEYARVAKPEVFIHFSTDEVYGAAPKDSPGHKEWDVILPSNPYSASKAAQESLAIAWWRSYGVPVIITNTMNNFGEMQGASKFPAMIQRKIQNEEEISVHATRDGEIGTRYYLHSRNASDAVLFILKNIQPHLHEVGEIDRPLRFNIVGDKQVSNLDMVQTIAKLMDKEAKYKLTSFHEKNPGHDLHYGLDGSLLKGMGWEAPLSFEESLKNTIKWQQENPEWL